MKGKIVPIPIEWRPSLGIFTGIIASEVPFMIGLARSLERDLEGEIEVIPP
jgi:hypothetical protein